MDLGIQGRTAIVCGASQGLGRACAEALAAEGVKVWLVARSEDALRSAAGAIVSSGGSAEWVAADVASAEGRSAILSACPDPDILVNNAGGPPPGDFRNFDRKDWIRALDTNMLAAIDLIQHTLDAMVERRFGRIVNITSHMVKAPVGFLALSNGARTGLTGFAGGVARDVAGHNVTVNNLLPGQFDTDRLRANHQKIADLRGAALDNVRESSRAAIPARRFGSPHEFGAACAFLCSNLAGYLTGQNLLLDGGQFPGLL